ncbi:ABC transporter permease [Mesorhizobium sp. LHD-90]|uniref:ABC transporter permease n=1 Tax=Mesorhizobium sp. LHD-90 TaxID=3071414 RepID=UPI0027E109EE|nr:ABC transporter permease [Mesorhizobium sp. LHD-90]MDQ6435331.1 ABC transporter permease [Mesorhizobium sp. LHD-90]
MSLLESLAPSRFLFRRKRYRPDLASQWQLMWWKFRRHKMAMVGMALLGVFLAMTLFAETISPYPPGQRNPSYVAGPPMLPRMIDETGAVHLRPFVYGSKAVRDMVTLRMTHQADISQKWPIRFFVRGTPYRLFGIIPTDIHLFGTDEGFVHLFGTDFTGLDLFSRTVHATRASLGVALVGVTVSFILGAAIGGIAGYFGGWIDNFIMRLIEFIRSIPTLPLWLALAALMPRDWGPLATYLAITTILALLGWTWLARTVRSKLLATRHEDFVLAARLSGCSDARIIRRHLLPSFLSYLIVDASIAFPEILLAETSLSFLGLGLREPVESWGVLLFAAQSIRAIDQAPWLMIPGVFVIIAVLAFNFVGDGLRDAADPYSKS